MQLEIYQHRGHYYNASTKLAHRKDKNDNLFLYKKGPFCTKGSRKAIVMSVINLKTHFYSDVLKCIAPRHQPFYFPLNGFQVNSREQQMRILKQKLLSFA